MRWLYILYLGCILACLLAGMRHFGKLDTPARIMSVLVGITLVSETIAYVAAKYYQNNLMVYAVFNVLQLTLLCLYFNYAIDLFKRFHIGVVAAVATIATGIFIARSLPHEAAFHSTFLMLEAFTIIVFSLFGLNSLLRRYRVVPIGKSPHFWFMLTWCTYWCLTGTAWSVYGYMSRNHPEYTSVLNFLLLILAMLTYVSMAFIFHQYPKMKTYHDRP